VVETSGSLRPRFGLRVAAAIARNARPATVRLAHCGAGGELGLHRPDAAKTLKGPVNATPLDDNLPVLRP
jgi:hypothetical protein